MSRFLQPVVSLDVLSRVSSTFVRVSVVPIDVLQVIDDIRLQSSRAGEEPGHQPEQLPAEGAGRSVETTHMSRGSHF